MIEKPVLVTQTTARCQTFSPRAGEGESPRLLPDNRQAVGRH